MSGTSSNAKYGKKREGTGKRYSPDFLGFVDVPLSDRDRDRLEEYVQPGGVDIEEFLHQVIDAGYKFSLSSDPEHNSCIATVTGKLAACENKGFALSARGPDALQAVVVLWYKVVVLANWGPWVQPGESGQQQIPLWR